MPYNLNDKDIACGENTIASMSDEEKIGQLFWQLCLSDSDEYWCLLLGTYHLGS